MKMKKKATIHRIEKQLNKLSISHARFSKQGMNFSKQVVLVDELASMVSWMVSEENSFTTGAVFDISGGRATY